MASDDLPDQYWHCYVQVKNSGTNRRDSYAIVNDLTLGELRDRVLLPWRSGQVFVVNGKLISDRSSIEEIKITQTEYSQQHYADIHNKKMRESNVGDLATDRKKIPIIQGVDYTHELLFKGGGAAITATSLATTNKIFVVHGHDNAMKEAVARFVEQNGLQPIILHEQPNSGRTVIEKFEAYSDVGFAIVLLTPDDKGAAMSEGELSNRARQNVVFEMGFFVGKIGRDKVAVLHKSDIELPSDISGIMYVKVDDAGAWKFLLAKELKEAGYNIDLNRCI